LVRRNSIIEPSPGSHVNVTFVDREGRVLETQAVDYLLRQIPSGIRGGLSQSRDVAHFAALPKRATAVKVEMRCMPSSGCPRCRGI
jgi:hypothetical protein